MEIIHTQAWGSLTDPPIDGEDISELNLFSKVRHELTINEQLGIILRGSRIVIPFSLRQRAIKIAHEGHQGLTKRKNSFAKKFGFPELYSLPSQ